MGVIGVVPHQERAEAVALAKATIARLEELGHTVRVAGVGLPASSLEPWEVPMEDFPSGLDLALSLGGDGTMLRTLELVGAAGVPVLGVNVGHLGYLTEVEPAGLEVALRRFAAGDCVLEERMTLEVLVERSGGPAVALRTAMNEAVVRSDGSHLVRLDVAIGGERFTTYAADALLVATPTGSTAYNLSARGPIVAPGLAAILVTPVAPHQLFDRTLVLDPDDEVRIELLDWRPGRLQCDGTEATVLAPGDVVVCRRGPWSAKVVTFGRRNFRAILQAKFGLADR